MGCFEVIDSGGAIGEGTRLVLRSWCLLAAPEERPQAPALLESTGNPVQLLGLSKVVLNVQNRNQAGSIGGHSIEIHGKAEHRADARGSP